jgi:Domain of unknown function (DUF4389)
MSADYPVVFDTVRPERFDRPQVFLRLVVLFVFSAVGSVGSLLYFGFPVLAGIMISGKGGQRFMEEDSPRVAGWLHWIVAVAAYVFFLSDRFPTERPETAARLEIAPSGIPTVGTAVLRIITSIPSVLVLLLLCIVSVVVWVVAAIWVLVRRTYPEVLYGYQRAVVRWGARLLAYHASIVDRYPPFAIDTKAETPSRRRRK